MQAPQQSVSSPHPSQTCRGGHGKPGKETQVLKRTLPSLRKYFFFQKNFIGGGNYKTFTVQCLQSQFVVNWFPKKYITTQVDLSCYIQKRTYLCQSSPEYTHGAPTVPTHETKRLLTHSTSRKAWEGHSCLFTLKSNSTSFGLSWNKAYSCPTDLGPFSALMALFTL